MKKKANPKATTVRSKATVVSPVEGAFDEIVELIRAARQQAVRAVNTELMIARSLNVPSAEHSLRR